MTKIFAESEVTLAGLEAHIRDSGLVPHKVQADGIWVRSQQGLGFRVSIIEGRKFIRIGTYLPLNRLASIEQKWELARQLNQEVFLPVFGLDDDADLTVCYVLPYAHGLIVENLISVLNRFASLLEYIVQSYNGDGLIDFGTSATASNTAGSETGSASGELLH
ncbi:YbjN domain-containing protein [Cupriavidus necator]|uniref:YbjN domain-containing protein n=1 Tax=Cupriavidus necator TaxID=106590 RepID=UPI0039C196D5